MPFHDEFKWCKRCRRRVRFLLSLTGSYCIHCGGEVFFFNDTDRQRLRARLRLHRTLPPLKP